MRVLMQPKLGFQWEDLYDPAKLFQLHSRFLTSLDPELYTEIYINKAEPKDFLIPLAMAIEGFIVELFQLEQQTQGFYDAHHQYRLASHFKRNFVQRDAIHAFSDVKNIDGDAVLARLSRRLGQEIDFRDEVAFARLGLAALSREDQESVDLFRKYAAWAFYSEVGRQRHQDGFLFKKPAPTIQHKRVTIQRDGDFIKSPTIKSRLGFNLTDKGCNVPTAVDEAFYCIKCHEREKDSCRKGFKTDDNVFKVDEHGQPLAGCPLDQKISEMNVLFEHGQLIAALAVVTLDNPMVAATGHRICYDCSRSCIFQKQEPVDIPSIETRLLKEVLSLPYGFEIYSLLTRWNPLNLQSPYPKKESGYHALIVGQGPSGFALAHLMMQEGHKVTAIDGLKIEPLPLELKDPSKPIKNIFEYYESLSERYAKGFGGVAEYGITVRWEKNFLFVIRLLLERRKLYECLDGVRFGSSINFDSAFNTYGFDHIALCLGAGSPTVLPLDNMTIPGVRLASDFLMALHLGDAAKMDSKTTLRIQLPLGVVGAGLTAVDAATEALAYYPVQVMNFYLRHQQIVNAQGPQKALEITQIDPQVAATFLEHGKIIYEEYLAAETEGRVPNYLPYLNEWGGVTIFYRNAIQQAPSYKLNPNELKSALAEGVSFVEYAVPTSIIPDKDNRLEKVEFNIKGEAKKYPMKTLLVAAGTKPNTVLAQEFEELKLEGSFFKPLDNQPFFVSDIFDGRCVSYLGDLHPEYTGSVVKALASAKVAMPEIHAAMMKNPPKGTVFVKEDFISVVNKMDVKDDIIHLQVYSPAAVAAYKPGQFFKLQPYGEGFTESIPLSPVCVDTDAGKIDFKINMVGATTRVLQTIKLNQRIYLMGPAGSKLNIPLHHRILFITDPGNNVDVTAPIRKHIPNAHHQIVAEINAIRPEDFIGFDSIFVSGSFDFIESFKAAYQGKLPCYTFVYTRLQCMMKQVCAQCIYTVKDSDGFLSVKFGCANSIETVDKISYSAINKRNKNEALEEAVLGCVGFNQPADVLRRKSP